MLRKLSLKACTHLMMPRHIAMDGNILESIRTFTRYLRFPRPSHCWHRGLLLSEVPISGDTYIVSIVMFSFMNILAKISKTENYTNWLLITGNLILSFFTSIRHYSYLRQNSSMSTYTHGADNVSP